MRVLLTVVVVVVPSVVVAQEAAAVVEPGMPWWQQVLVAFFVGFGGLVLEFLRRGLSKLFDYFAEKSHLAFLAKVDDAMMGVVTSLYNREVEAVKAAAADGKLTAEERTKFRSIAIEEAKSLLGAKGLAKLATIFGARDKAELAIANTVEKAVTAAKIAGAAKKAPDPSAPLSAQPSHG